MRRTKEQRKEEIISELISARQAVLSEIITLPEDRLDEPSIGIWCVKDLLAHLIGWDHTNTEAVQQILAGQRPTFFQHYDKDWQAYNAHLVAIYRKGTLHELLADAETSHSQLVELLQSVSADELIKSKSPPEQGRTVTILSLLRAEARDERKHAEQIHTFFAPSA